MKKVIIIIVCILVVIGIGFGIYVHVNKPKAVTLTSEEISNYNKTTTEFLNSLNNNDYKEYASLTTSEMGSQKIFNELVNFKKEDLGELKKLNYLEALKTNEYEGVIYNGDFSINNNFKFAITWNNDNKIEGFKEA